MGLNRLSAWQQYCGSDGLNQSRWIQRQLCSCISPAFYSSLTPQCPQDKIQTDLFPPSSACRGGKKVCEGLPNHE